MGQFTGFSQRKKDALKEKVTDTFPSENGKQYKYPRPLMHLRLSICFYSDESKALETCQKRKTSCGSLQGSDSCRISISHEGLTKEVRHGRKGSSTFDCTNISGILPNGKTHVSRRYSLFRAQFSEPLGKLFFVHEQPPSFFTLL